MPDSYKHELLIVLLCFCFSQFFFRHTKPHTVTSPSLPASTTRSPTRTSRTPFPLSHYVRTGPSHVGTGVFARRRMRADIVIGEIHGEIFSESPEDPSYCMELPSEKVLEPVAPLRFINHSCDPNSEIFYWEADDPVLQEDRLWLQTLRVIESGEELTIDYAWPANAAIVCRCGAGTCRGWIVSPEELSDVLDRGVANSPSE